MEVAWAINNIKKLGSGSRSGSGSGHKAVIDWEAVSQKSSVKCQKKLWFHYANLVHLHWFQQKMSKCLGAFTMQT